MPRHARLAALTLALTPLAACSSGANPADVDPTFSTFTAGGTAPATAAVNPNAATSPSPGSVVSDDKVFNFVVPPGWNLTKNPKAVVYLSSATVAHDVAPTIVVTKSDVMPAPALEESVQMSMMQARQGGATVTRLPERTIGAEKAVAFTATEQEKNVDVTRTYTLVAHDKSLYVITLTSAKADASRDQGVLSSLLSSWTWTKAGDKNSTASGTTPAQVPTSTSSSASASDSSSGSTSSGSSSDASGASSTGASSKASSTASSTSSPTSH